MKNLITIIMVLFFTVSAFASNNKSTNKFDQIEKNLLVGLNSDNLELKVSCAYFLGEIKSDKAIIPLMKMLKTSDAEEERIIAALSLSKIPSERGIFAVKQRIKFDDSERVQRLCEIFYKNYLQNDFNGTVIVEPFEVALNIEYNGVKLAKFLNN